MNYTPDMIEQVEKYASIYLPITDMALLMDLQPEVLREDIRNRKSDISKAYYCGKAASRVKLHHQEMLLAQVGSPVAIENAHRNLLDMEDDE
ncbi:MAG: hypothetical protein KBT34_04945 [Prevotella sp.]|nr:hypothetical protein [Candidatus Prevotella equi]